MAEIKVNVEEANQLLQSVGELAMSFQPVPVETSSDDLDTMSEVAEVKAQTDERMTAFMSALAQAQLELQALIQGYEDMDNEIATEIATQATSCPAPSTASSGSSSPSGGAPFEQPAPSESAGGAPSPFVGQPVPEQSGPTLDLNSPFNE